METERSDVDIATAWQAAVVAGDVEAAIALSSPTIVYTTGDIRRYEGHDGIRDIVSDLERLSGFLTVTVLDTVEKPGVVAPRRFEQYILPAGSVEITGCSFVEVEDGVVTRWADYKSMGVLDDLVG